MLLGWRNSLWLLRVVVQDADGVCGSGESKHGPGQTVAHLMDGPDRDLLAQGRVQNSEQLHEIGKVTASEELRDHETAKECMQGETREAGQFEENEKDQRCGDNGGELVEHGGERVAVVVMEVVVLMVVVRMVVVVDSIFCWDEEEKVITNNRVLGYVIFMISRASNEH